MNLGSWAIDGVLTWTVQTHNGTGAQADADSVPTYRVYEDETTTPLLTGSMALLDSSNTDGFYSEAITLSAANGFETGKSYTIRTTATVNGVTGATLRFFQVGAFVTANVTQLSGDSTAADNAEAFFDGTGYAGTGNVIPTVPTLTNLPTIPANWITAASIATGAIDADALAADAVTEIAAGVSSSGGLSSTQDTTLSNILKVVTSP